MADPRGAGSFELLLFSSDPALIAEAEAGGVAGVVVDWEREGKAQRQAQADTQIGADTLEDLRRARAGTRTRLLCRINGHGPWTAREVAQALNEGADELLVPMVRRPAEVEAVLELAGGRCGVGILVETRDAVRQAAELARLPLTRAYLGLNDLAIEFRSASIFAAVADGTLEAVRGAFDVPFGFGGLTAPEGGFPIACRLLMGEMARLGCRYSFLRRSFHRDVRGRDVAGEVARLLKAIDGMALRTPGQVEADRLALRQAIERASARPTLELQAGG
jgi:hypothetical protein